MPNRTMCEVLEEMRKCYETRNFAYLLGLIEEAQSMGNRMEAAIQDKHDLEYYRRELSKVKEKVREARAELDELNTKLGKSDEARVTHLEDL